MSETREITFPPSEDLEILLSNLPSAYLPDESSTVADRGESPFELRYDMPIFFPSEYYPDTIAKVLRAPLEISCPPFEIRGKYAPTPLDGLRIRTTNGPLYDDSALIFMGRAMDFLRTADSPIMTLEEGIEYYESNKARIPDEAWLSAMHENRIQHELKLRRNYQALMLLEKDETKITRQEAEELMQIRAGIASIPVMMRFLARYPQLGGIEIMKATRPFRPVGTKLAHVALARGLHMIDEPDIDIIPVSGRPEMLRIRKGDDLQDEPDPRIIVFKTIVAKAAIQLAESDPVLQEVVCRDSGVILEPRADGLKTALYRVSHKKKPASQYAAPITFTAYVRPAKEAA